MKNTIWGRFGTICACSPARFWKCVRILRKNSSTKAPIYHEFFLHEVSEHIIDDVQYLSTPGPPVIDAIGLIDDHTIV